MPILVSGSMAGPDLRVFCDELKDRIQALPDVSLVELASFSDRQLRIELSPTALLAHGLSASEVADIIKQQSVEPASINLQAGRTRINSLLDRGLGPSDQRRSGAKEPRRFDSFADAKGVEQRQNAGGKRFSHPRPWEFLALEQAHIVAEMREATRHR